jgi:hypothetical protein
MTSDDWLAKNCVATGLPVRVAKKREDGTILLVSLSSICFSKKTKDGYFESAPHVFFSELLYLFYVKKVKGIKGFDTAREKAKAILISHLEKMKDEVLATETMKYDVYDGKEDVDRKLNLLDSAISVLEGGRNVTTVYYPGYY